MLPKPLSGFNYGIQGSVGGTLASFQRAARATGRAEPVKTTGTPGQGRAAVLSAYTVSVTRLADGRRVERTTAPGYHSKKQWAAEIKRLVDEMLRDLAPKS